uniref:TTF-type domain-containing protein n=1 Tax=Latimeria chalumnae TaxID=7897 RepID=H3ATE8_LATCH
DPGEWPEVVGDALRVDLVKKGPKKIKAVPEYEFPQDNKKKLNNGEKVERSWLVYSKAKNTVFCFTCKLFRSTVIKLTKDGYCTWRELSRALRDHEVSNGHMKAMQQWKQLSIWLKSEILTTIDAHSQRTHDMEQLHWRASLDWIIVIVQFLAERNLTLHGNVDRLFEPHNGNFLGQVELMAKYEAVMAEHLRHIQSKEIHDHYLGKTIQNEIISLLAKKISEKIKQHIIQAKYYSIILDYTSDTSRKEQLSVCIRVVEAEDTINISEHFMDFLTVSDTTGAGLTEVLLTFLQEQGIKADLIICDAAHSSKNAISFLGYLQRIYTFYAASTHRWETLRKYCKLIPKPLGDTCWEYKVDNTKVLRHQSSQVQKALLKIREKNGAAFTEAQSLANKVGSFRFLTCLVIWHEILTEINRISKYLQDPKVEIGTALDMIDAAYYLENGFEKAKYVATELADSLGIHPEFLLQPKRSSDCESGDEPIENAQQYFKAYRLVHIAPNSLDDRFQLMEKHGKLFGFLYSIKDLEGIDADHLNKQCMDLQLALTGTEEVSDVDGIDLANELHSLSKILPTNCTTSLDALCYIHKSDLVEIYPNVSVALRVALTVPVIVASAEHSFSKLKLLKSHLRSNMSQERLRGLALIFIEHAVRKTLDYSELIETFAAEKSHKATF